MDADRFDTLTRTLTDGASRRMFVVGLATVIGLGAADYGSGVTIAKKGKTKHKKKPLLRNTFGCVDVGGKCRGNSANCCSGICQGKKPKKGQKDKSLCVAHDELDCQVSADTCETGEPACGTNGNGVCYFTTGRASFCAKLGLCWDCKKDADCEADLDFGPGAACGVCANCPGGTICATASV